MFITDAFSFDCPVFHPLIHSYKNLYSIKIETNNNLVYKISTTAENISAKNIVSQKTQLPRIGDAYSPIYIVSIMCYYFVVMVGGCPPSVVARMTNALMCCVCEFSLMRVDDASMFLDQAIRHQRRTECKRKHAPSIGR